MKAYELMGKVVLVRKRFIRVYDRTLRAERKTWGVSLSSGRPGWVVGERWLQDGCTRYDQLYGNAWDSKGTKRHHALLVCFWPNMRPAYVPMDGYEVASKNIFPYPTPQEGWTEGCKQKQRILMENWPRDEKGRWAKKELQHELQDI